jgi:hypothetical protein
MSATLQPVTGIALSAWASYLINNDTSGIDGEDKRQADLFAAFMGGRICYCEDVGFCWHHDGCRFGALAGDCQRYTALVELKPCPAA